MLVIKEARGTDRKVEGSIPDGVIRIFIYLILLAALWPWELLSLLTEMSTRNNSWAVKAVGA